VLSMSYPEDIPAFTTSFNIFYRDILQVHGLNPHPQMTVDRAGNKRTWPGVGA